MIVRLSVAAGLVAAAIALAPYTVSAMPLTSQADALAAAAAEGTLVEKTQWGYCRRVRQDCAFRWGWRTWRYFRCVGARGCG
jgi:hypothetical protein